MSACVKYINTFSRMMIEISPWLSNSYKGAEELKNIPSNNHNEVDIFINRLLGFSMSSTEKIDLGDWLSRCDIGAVPDFDDKLRECEFFFDALSAETNRNRFRWLVSAFLNAAYSFFESTALTTYFRYTDPESGDPYEDDEGLAVLRQHIKVFQNAKNPNFVKTAGLTPITQQLYEFRKKNTHHFPLSIMTAGPKLPDDFHFGNMRNEGVPVIPLCRDSMALIRSIYMDING